MTKPANDELRELDELDCWLAKVVFGWTNIELYQPQGEFMEDNPPPFLRGRCKDEFWMQIPRYTTDPGAALAVWEKCVSEITATTRKQSDGFYIIWFDHPACLESYVKAETLPLAIARFAKLIYSKKATGE